MEISLEKLCEKAKHAVPTATTKIYPDANQIIVGFTSRPDIEIALLTPYSRIQVKKLCTLIKDFNIPVIALYNR